AIPGIVIDAGHHRDRIFGACADAVSRLAANGGIFRAWADIRMADGCLLVSHAGSRRHTRKHGSGAVVGYQLGALAVIAPRPIIPVAYWIIRCPGYFWLLTTGCPG